MTKLLKSHITQIQNFITGRLQSPQRITKSFFASQKLQLAKPFFRQKPQERERGREGEREREREKEKDKEEEKKKDERKKNGESGT